MRMIMNEEQKRFIIENYANMDTNEIAKIINVEPIKVYKFASSKGIKKETIRNGAKFTVEQKEFIIKNYAMMTNSEISKITGLNKKIINKIATVNKLKKSKGFSDRYGLSYDKRLYIMKNASSKTPSEIAEVLHIRGQDVTSFCKMANVEIKKGDGFNNSKTYTIKQKKFITNNYSTMTTRDIAKALNLTVDDVRTYASNSGLVKNIDACYNKNNYIELLLEKRHGDYCVLSYLGNTIESQVDGLYKSKFGKYAVNDTYFDRIDNEFKAYWLGFLYADGCVRLYDASGKKVNTLSIGLSSVDVAHIEKFKNSIQSEHPIKHKIHKNGIYQSDSITITNERLCENLNSLGCTPRKSLTLKFPNFNQVPKHLVRHFIRGYFDGDGCIHVNLEKRKASVSFVGTEEFLDSLQDILCEELGITKTKKHKKENNEAFQICWGNIESIERIYKYLYKDCNIYLQRKLEKFDILYCLD